MAINSKINYLSPLHFFKKGAIQAYMMLRELIDCVQQFITLYAKYLDCSLFVPQVSVVPLK